MQKRSYSARRINVTEKPGRLSGFSSLQSCSSQPEQNETDEPPSLFNPLSADIGLYGLSQINTRPFRLVNSQPLLFLSKMHILKEGKGLFIFATGRRERSVCNFTNLFDPIQWNNSSFIGSKLVSEATTVLIPCGLNRLKQKADCFGALQEEGFIVRDNWGRIKTIIFYKKRST